MKYIINRLTLLTALLISGIGFSQKNYVNMEWVSNSMAIDTIYHTASIVYQGNLYVTGNTINGSGDTDIMLIKYDSNGDTVFCKTYDGSAGDNDYGIDLVANNSGDIIVAGTAQTTSGGYDYAVLSYASSDGSLNWSYIWDGDASGMDIPSKLCVDNSDNVYVSGGSEATNGYSDYGMIGLNSSGALQWQYFYDANDYHDAGTTASMFFYQTKFVSIGVSSNDIADYDLRMVAVDADDGDLFLTSTPDTLPVTLKEVFGMTTDQENNLYVTGYSEDSDKDIQTVKIDSNFNYVWMTGYDGGYDDVGKGVGVDTSGNVYVTGYTELSGGGYNFITIKYSENGDTLWVREEGNLNGLQDARAEDIGLTTDGDVYITGTVEEDEQTSISLIRYNPSGKLQMHQHIESDTVNYRAYDLSVYAEDVYISGLAHDTGNETLTVAKFSVFEKNQPIVYCDDTIPCYADDEVLIRFNPDDLIYSNVDNKQIKWGEVSDFVSQSAITTISDSVGFDITRLRCYKVFPNFTSSDTTATSRFGNTMKLPHFYATFGMILPESTDDSAAVVDFNSAIPHVIATGHNLAASLTATANDSYYTSGESAGLAPTVSIPDANININRAWDYETGIPDVIVGVYDGGLNYAHKDWSDGDYATSSVVGGYDYIHDLFPDDVEDPDNNGHGTAIGGIIGAWRNNSYGIAGIAGGDGSGGVSLHDMKMNDVDNYTPEPCDSLREGIYASEILTAIADGSLGTGPIPEPQHIQNHSWNINKAPNVFIREAFITAYEAGVITCVSAGNGGLGYPSCISNEYPGNYPDHMIIQVGGNGTDGDLWEGGLCPANLDFIAPSTHELYICLGHEDDNFTDGQTFGYMLSCSQFLDGTSLAAPHAAGVIGLMLSYAKNNAPNVPEELAMEDCEYLIEQNATALAGTLPDPATAWGRLNAGETFDHFWYPKYKIQHDTFSVDLSNATLDASGEYTCLEKSLFGLTAGTTVKVNRYKLTASNTHSAPSGYNLLDGWARGSASSNVIGIASTPSSGDVDCEDKDNPYFLPAEVNPTLNSVSATGATMTGYIYEILDAAGDPVGWFPPFIDTATSQALFAYTTYWEDPSISGLEEGESEFKLYPNPANANCTVEFLGDDLVWNDIVLMDISGQLLKTVATSNNLSTGKSVTFNVGDLSQGMYYVVIRTEDKSLVQKLVISQ